MNQLKVKIAQLEKDRAKLLKENRKLKQIISETINIDICYTTCSESGDKIIDTEMMLEDYFDKVNTLINQN